MFRKAYLIGSKFTLPVIISSRFIDGRVECGIGSFILLNKDGWILTAAHIMSAMMKAQEDALKIEEYNHKILEIENDERIESKTKRKRINRLNKDNNWIINQSYWWAYDPFIIEEFTINPLKDIALARISNFLEASEQIYPVFSKTDDSNIGESVCKLGYPLHDVKAEYVENINRFILAPNTLPVPRFPIEGIISRFNLIIDENGDKTKFIETTSPGLRGQSGGPIMNVDGEIYAMQIRTQHYALGFNPEIIINGRHVIEHQFLNTGIGISSDDIIKLCNENSISINVREI
jgi:hypothetical protein